MSYCVHCGVELAPSERVCPLCQTEVNDPKQPFDPSASRPYPPKLDLFAYERSRWLLVLIATLLLALPAMITLACDIAYTDRADWSLLVIGAMGLLWIVFVPHLFAKKYALARHLLLDTVALLCYLLLIEHLTGGDWFLQLALPIVLLFSALLTAETMLMKYLVTDPLLRSAMALLAVPPMVIGIELALDLYIDKSIYLIWSWIVSIPCVILATVLFLIFRQAKLRSELERRLFL